MADEKSSFPSTRGLVDADIGPLRRLIGTLSGLPQETESYGEGEKKRDVVRVTVFVTDIQVVEAIEPYQLPTFSTTMSLSNKRKSKWGFFSDGSPEEKAIGFNNIVDQQYTAEQLDPSSEQFIKPSERMDIKDAIGKKIGMVVADGEEGRPAAPMLWDGRANGGEGGDVATPCWTVYMVEGVGIVGGGSGKTPQEMAEDLLDGKTLKEFNDAVMNVPAITNDKAMLQAISLPATAPNSFASASVTAGKFALDAETKIYRKVTEVEAATA